MARPRKFDREDVLNRMKLAFWENGFNDISMDDVGRITNMNRGSIYNAFGDKRALYLEVLEVYGDQHYGAAVKLIQHSQNTSSAVRDLYDAAFKSMEEGRTHWGCFMCNAAVEVAPVDTEVANLVTKYLTTLSTAFLNSLEESDQLTSQNDSPAMKYSKNPQNLAEQLTASYVGFNIMARTGVATASLQRISDSAVESVTS